MPVSVQILKIRLEAVGMVTQILRSRGSEYVYAVDVIDNIEVELRIHVAEVNENKYGLNTLLLYRSHSTLL